MSRKTMDKSSRLSANPCVSVADLASIFETWLKMSLSKDIYTLLSPPDGKLFAWKTTPNHKWLAKVAPLYTLLVKIVPNTVLTSKKLMMALEHLRTKKLITNSTAMADELFDDWCDQTIRILFAKYREVKRDQVLHERVRKKCTMACNSANSLQHGGPSG